MNIPEEIKLVKNILNNRINDINNLYNIECNNSLNHYDYYLKKKKITMFIKKKINCFQNDKNVNCKNIINFSKDKDFIYYFSIFNNFDDIYLLYLYDSNQLELYQSNEYYKIVNFFNTKYLDIYQNICKNFEDEDEEIKKNLFNYFSDILGISENDRYSTKKIIEKLDIYLEEYKKNNNLLKRKNKELENYSNNILEKNKELENLIRQHEYINNKIIEKQNLLKKYKFDLDAKELDKINKKLSKNLVNEITQNEIIENNKKELKKKIVSTENKIISLKNEFKLQKINKEITSKYNKINLFEKKKKINNTEKYNTIIEDLYNEVELLKLDKDIESKIFRNKIIEKKQELRVYELELIDINKKLEKKKDNFIKDISDQCKSIQNDIEVVTKDIFELTHQYSSIEEQIDKLKKKKENLKRKYKRHEEKINIDNINFEQKYSDNIKIKSQVTDYLGLLEKREKKIKNIFSLKNVSNIDNLLKKYFIKSNLSEEMDKVFLWKLNINIQIKIYELDSYKNVVEDLTYIINKILFEKKYIFFVKNDSKIDILSKSIQNIKSLDYEKKNLFQIKKQIIDLEKDFNTFNKYFLFNNLWD